MNEKKKDHIYMVDVCRFVAIILIMAHHRYVIGYEGDYFGKFGWAWVDYFFMLTGYFTMCHFKEQYLKTENVGKDAVIYTVRKIKGLLGITFVTIILYYAISSVSYIQQGQSKVAMGLLANMPLELALLPSAGFFQANMAPIWFLSAMVLMLPLLIYLLVKLEDAWYILSFLIPILYYGRCGMNTDRVWPMDMIRAFACMTFGTFVYYLVKEVQKRQWNGWKKITLTIVEITSFLLAFFMTGWNVEALNLLVILFPVQLACMLSGCSYTANLKGRVWKFLGEMSMPMYVIHWLIAAVTLHFWSERVGRTIAYYSITIVIAAVYVVAKQLRRRRRDA